MEEASEVWLSLVESVPSVEDRPKAAPAAEVCWTTNDPTLGIAIDNAVATDPTAITVEPNLDAKPGLRLSNSYFLSAMSTPLMFVIKAVPGESVVRTRLKFSHLKALAGCTQGVAPGSLST